VARRQALVARVREGTSMRAVAREFRVSLSTVRWWVRRAGQTPLDQVDWTNQPTVPRKTRRTIPAIEALVLTVRQELKEQSALGEYGARAIYRELLARGHETGPAVRTIGRILLRRGALDSQHRVRRAPPPRGWYLPAVAHGEAEADSFDIIEGLVLRGGLRFEVLSAISIHGGLPGAWPMPLVSAKLAVEALVGHWRRFGVPTYAQFDNDTIFQGGHHGQDSIGRVVRTCLQLGVTPVFAPPREPGFQAAIESFNARWQAKVWVRFYHESLPALGECTERYLTAVRLRARLGSRSRPAGVLFR
jgi:putative transposase